MNPVKASIETSKILVGRFRDLPVLRLPNTSLMHKFPCLLESLPTSLKWSAPFFNFSLPSGYRGTSLCLCHWFKRMNLLGPHWRQSGDPVVHERVLSHSTVSNSLLPCQAPLSVRFFRSKYWSGLPISSPPGDLPNPGMEPVFFASCIGGQILYYLTSWKAQLYIWLSNSKFNDITYS